MNAKFVSAAATAAASYAASLPGSGADALIAAANRLLTDLERGVAVDARTLRTAMIASFGASDAEGGWDWKTAYEAVKPRRSCSCASSARPCTTARRRLPATSRC